MSTLLRIGDHNVPATSAKDKCSTSTYPSWDKSDDALHSNWGLPSKSILMPFAALIALGLIGCPRFDKLFMYDYKFDRPITLAMNERAFPSQVSAELHKLHPFRPKRAVSVASQVLIVFALRGNQSLLRSLHSRHSLSS